MTWQVLFSNPGPRPAKGTPTRLNLLALEREIEEGGGVIGLLPATSLPHIRRCLKAGLLESTGERGRWKLSPKGVEALKQLNARQK